MNVKEIKELIVSLYQQYNIKRKYRMVKDGVWIFGLENSTSGLFVSKYGAKEDLIFSYLTNCDDDLIHIIEKDNKQKFISPCSQEKAEEGW